MSGEHHHHKHMHDSYKSTVFSELAPLDPEIFSKLLNDGIKGVYRLKGQVFFGMKGLAQVFMVQYVAGRWSMKINKDLSSRPKTELVIIGDDFDEARVLPAFKACIDKNPNDLKDATMLDIFQYQ